MSYVVRFAECGADVDRVGGKCASLGTLTEAGLAVPPGFAITTAAFAETLAAAGLDREVQEAVAGADPADIQELNEMSARVRERIESAPVPAAIEAGIRTAYDELAELTDRVDPPVAVRSSATAEDLPDASFAGQQDTFLWITGADAVVDHVRRCWSSLYTARSIAYRHDHGFADHPALMGVGVQQMVEARVAGVALTMNPINGDRSKIVIDASFGLGEAVVSGHVTPDNFVVDKVLLEVLARTISAKHVELVPDVDGRRVVERAVEPDRQSTPSLASQEVKAIAALAKQVERHYGCPQDVEWALDHDGSVFLLQSRPETIWTRSGAAPARAASYETGMAGLLNTLLNPLAAKESADVDDR